jgi:hypothetical protein
MYIWNHFIRVVLFKPILIAAVQGGLQRLAYLKASLCLKLRCLLVLGEAQMKVELSLASLIEDTINLFLS